MNSPIVVTTRDICDESPCDSSTGRGSFPVEIIVGEAIKGLLLVYFVYSSAPFSLNCSEYRRFHVPVPSSNDLNFIVPSLCSFISDGRSFHPTENTWTTNITHNDFERLQVPNRPRVSANGKYRENRQRNPDS